MDDRPTVLILGGTAEARRLAEALAPHGLRIVTSLAGRTEAPHMPLGEVRVGGFGGVEGLTDWLAAERPRCVVDATHPFAERISANAAAACDAAGLPRLVLRRPGWHSGDGDNWIFAADAAEAARMLPDYGRRAFLAIGGTDLEAFAATGVTLVVRAISHPPGLPDGATFISGRGPFFADAEEDLFRAHAIDVVVAKDSGGEAVGGKLTAARRMGLPIIMIRRPAPPPGAFVESVEDAVKWVLAWL